MTHGRIGLDIGSTTVKIVHIDPHGEITYHRYERHHADVREKTAQMLKDALQELGDISVVVTISGSAGLGISEDLGLPFVQEVFATKAACEKLIPNADVAIELGGEDAKILFLTGGAEERMNGSCAGGTGAFIDQMASLLDLSLQELDELSLSHKELYPIASRCGVFAKSDIQPLINQGAAKSDMCASIHQSIVEQTVVGLAQGREIKGTVAFLGGPLTFMMGLRDRFIKTLNMTEETALFPPMALYFVAYGAAILGSGSSNCSGRDTNSVDGNGTDSNIRGLSELSSLFTGNGAKSNFTNLPPLFSSEEELQEFTERHNRVDAERIELSEYSGTAYLGIDAGSTTTKLALIDPNGALLYSFYMSNKGEPLPVLRKQLLHLYELCGERIKIGGAVVTGYGEGLIKHAFSLDAGIVETTAHYLAARHFCPDVDFILDVGGQDMKCFRLDNGRVTSILLNEACSSGCGSFIEAFASALGYSTSDFAKIGLTAQNPVDLGSRCTVFMNSSVKQAQKDGAAVADISAGLAMSVVKNVLYKVIRQPVGVPLGKSVVVQGGTFYNDCVLRSLEVELGLNVTRPVIAGIMGAYGCALHARNLALEKSKIAPPEKLEAFTHKTSSFSCQICPNFCRITLNTFSDGKFLSSNRCEKPLGNNATPLPDAFQFKLDYITDSCSTMLYTTAVKANTAGTNGSSDTSISSPRGKIGFPLGLNFWEILPFWNAIFTKLGFETVLSPLSSRQLYALGQNSIPSDTACYPAKLMHGHIEELVAEGIDTIFYPCMTYNFDENTGDNHYNCPVVAYYPELLAANMDVLANVRFLFPHLAPAFKRSFKKMAARFFADEFGIPKSEVLPAIEDGYKALDAYNIAIRNFGENAIKTARELGKPIFVLAGRPYHIDPGINHGINKLLTSLGGVVLSEDCISDHNVKQHVKVLNQWTYHSRLYSAAHYVTQNKDMQLIQLVSFGCGLDAVTTDEVQEILEKSGKFYTQIKIDEITNLGAARIRLRSLIEAMRGDGT